MRITDKHVQQAVRAYSDQFRPQGANGVRPPQSVGQEIELSRESQEFLVATQALRNLPEVDEGLVVRLRQAIEDGTYRVNAERIAENMLGQHLDMRL